MTGLMDASVHLAKESTYGTWEAPTRSFEALVDDWKKEQAQLESNGMRTGRQTTRSDRRKQIPLGGSGSLQLDLLNKGFGLLLEGILPVTTGPTQVAATTAYQQTHSTDDDGSADSYSIQVWRPYADNSGIEEFSHAGCVPTSWKLAQPSEDLAKLEIAYDFQSVSYDEAAATPAYPANSDPFCWPDAKVTIDGTDFDEVLSFELNGDLGMRTDRRYLQASALKKAPKRAGVPTYTGQMDADWVKTEFYDDFVAGTIVPVIFTWEIAGDSIESGQDYQFIATCQACQFDGDSPTVGTDSAPSQSLPFKVLHDGTNPAVVFSLKTTDTAL